MQPLRSQGAQGEKLLCETSRACARLVKEIQASKKAKKAKEASGASLEIEMMLANVGAEGTERYSPVTMQQIDARSAIKSDVKTFDATEAYDLQDFADARL